MAGDIEAAFIHCQAETLSEFGSDKLYVECLLPAVSHIKVWIFGDGKSVVHLSVLLKQGQRICLTIVGADTDTSFSLRDITPWKLIYLSCSGELISYCISFH